LLISLEALDPCFKHFWLLLHEVFEKKLARRAETLDGYSTYRSRDVKHGETA